MAIPTLAEEEIQNAKYNKTNFQILAQFLTTDSTEIVFGV